MSFEPIVTDLFSDRYRPLPAVMRPPLKPGPMTETSARKLRAKGLSYRRIASELRVRYDRSGSHRNYPPGDRGNQPVGAADSIPRPGARCYRRRGCADTADQRSDGDIASDRARGS